MILAFTAQAQRDFIEKTMAEISTKVCIKFVKKTNESTYVSIVNDDTKKRCFSSVGYTLSPGPRNVQLANWCLAVLQYILNKCK